MTITTRLPNNSQLIYPRFQSANIRLLHFSILTLLSGVVICAISIAILPEFEVEWRFALTNNSYLKFIPLFFLIFSVITIIPALSFHQLISNTINTLSANWGLTIYALFALLGSAYARFILKQETSYFTQAVMFLSFHLAYFVFNAIPDQYWTSTRNRVIRTFWIVALLAALSVLSKFFQYLFLDTTLNVSNHDIAFLLVQLITLAFYSYKGLKRFCLVGIIVVLSILTFKNTAIVMVVATGILLFLFPLQIGSSGLIWKLVGGFLTVGLVLTIYPFVRNFNSDGNVSFRSDVYLYQFNRFLESPYFGYLFTAETGVDWASFLHSQNRHWVPTHNDWLDVLVQSGLIGFLFFFGAFIWILYALYLARRKWIISFDRVHVADTSWILLLIVNNMITMTFNPILGHTDMAYIVWIALAFGHRIITIKTPFPSTDHLRENIVNNHGYRTL